jgi:hypothetical protein
MLVPKLIEQIPTTICHQKIKQICWSMLYCVLLRYDHLSSQTVTLYKIGRSPQVVRCAPKLGLEGRWLHPKVLSTCHDGASLQNVSRRLVAEPTFYIFYIFFVIF